MDSEHEPLLPRHRLLNFPHIDNTQSLHNNHRQDEDDVINWKFILLAASLALLVFGSIVFSFLPHGANFLQYQLPHYSGVYPVYSDWHSDALVSLDPSTNKARLSLVNQNQSFNTQNDSLKLPSLSVAYVPELQRIPYNFSESAAFAVDAWGFYALKLKKAKGSVRFVLDSPATVVFFQGLDALNVYKTWSFIPSERIIYYRYTLQDTFTFHVGVESEYFFLVQGQAAGNVSFDIQTYTFAQNLPKTSYFDCNPDCRIPVTRDGFLLVSVKEPLQWRVFEPIRFIQVSISTNIWMFMTYLPIYTILVTLAAAVFVYLGIGLITLLSSYFECEDEVDSESVPSIDEEFLPRYEERSGSIRSIPLYEEVPQENVPHLSARTSLLTQLTQSDVFYTPTSHSGSLPPPYSDPEEEIPPHPASTPSEQSM